MNTTYLNERRRAERVSFAFPVRTSTGIVGEVINFSRTGIRFALEKPLLSTRTIPIKIDFPFSFPLESYVEIVWNRPQPENNRFLCGARFLRLKNNEEVILKEAIGRFNVLDRNFTFLTVKMRDWLVNFKMNCDQFDLMYPHDSDRNQFVEKNKLNLDMTLDNYFKNIWKTTENIIPEDYSTHLRYYREMLGCYLIDSIEIGRFMCHKPLGYAGDFMIMNYLYDYIDHYFGISSYEKINNFYICNTPIAYSVVKRKEFFKQKILDTLAKKDSARILSVASGPARELIELVEEGRIDKPLYFDCLDVELGTFEHIKKNLEKILPENKKNLSIRFIHTNFLDLIKGRDIHDLFKKYDFVYSSGLFDYLTDRIARKSMFYLFGLLDSNASLVVTNAMGDNYHRAYYEMLYGWKLIHRSEKEMLDLASEIKERPFAEIVKLNTEKPFMFWILSLHKSPVNLQLK